MWLFSRFIREPAKVVLSHPVTAGNKKDQKQEAELTTYCKAVKYLLKTYATNDVISEADAEITNFKQPTGMTAVCHCEVLWEKALGCGRVYDEPRLKAIFIEGTHSSIRNLMRTYWGAHKETTLHNLALHVTLLVKLPEDTITLTSSAREETRSRRKSSRSTRDPENHPGNGYRRSQAQLIVIIGR